MSYSPAATPQIKLCRAQLQSYRIEAPTHIKFMRHGEAVAADIRKSKKALDIHGSGLWWQVHPDSDRLVGSSSFAGSCI